MSALDTNWAEMVAAHRREMERADKAEERAAEQSVAFRQRIEDLVDALSIVLPMAKGYAYAHPVGSNAEKVADAAALITCSACDGQTIQTGPSGLTDCIRCNPPQGAD